MKCKHCHAENNQIKAVKTATGKSKNTNGKYIRESLKKGFIEVIREIAAEQSSGILVIGKNMCLYWIRKYAKTLRKKKYQTSKWK